MKDYSNAVKDFKKARDRAALERLVARLNSRSSELLSYEDVRQKVRATGVISHSLKEVPLEAIVGSVNRYNDFTRRFLPKKDSDQSRWMRVYQATSESPGLPPVDLYKIGEVYFVVDGHHRVSVSRQMGAEVIQAFVTEIRSKVPIDPSLEPDELIIKAEYADFLTLTGLDSHDRQPDLNVTRAGKYQELLEHIEVHRYHMGSEKARAIGYQEAASHWYENVYEPVVDIINELGLLLRFPGRTETDLYLWIGKYRAEKEAELGWEIKDSAAAAALVNEFGGNQSSVIGRIGKNALEVVFHDVLEPSTPTGQWRRERQLERGSGLLFREILVPISGSGSSWTALEQAIVVAQREGAKVNGLYVQDDGENDGAHASQIRDKFHWRCSEVGIPYTFNTEEGAISKAICSRARWVDLVVFNLAHPPKADPAARLTSGVRKIINRCTRPMLSAPGKSYSISKALLAFDGSPKSREALYVATYIAGSWNLPLIVATINNVNDREDEIINEAQKYLEQSDIKAEYIVLKGQVDRSLLEISDKQNCDLIIVGGYGSGPIRGLIRNSAVDAILRNSSILTLICQ